MGRGDPGKQAGKQRKRGAYGDDDSGGDGAVAGGAAGGGMTGEERRAAKLAHFHRELSFFERVKSRLRSREAYHDFLKCLQIYSLEIIGEFELEGLVQDVLGRFPDLVSGFSDFLARCKQLDVDSDWRQSRAPPGQSAAYRDPKLRALAARERQQGKPVSELDLTSSERCGLSYRRLPANYPRPVCSGRRLLQPDLAGESVLNDAWVSVTSGTEDFSFRHTRKNQYEESLFRCEDDRFELEMVLMANARTIEILTSLNEVSLVHLSCALCPRRSSVLDPNPRAPCSFFFCSLARRPPPRCHPTSARPGGCRSRLRANHRC